MRTPGRPENPSSRAHTVTPHPQSPSPPHPTPQTTRCSGGRACSGRGDSAGREEGAPVEPRGVPGVRLKGSPSRDWLCSDAQRDRNLILWCGPGWNTWACLPLASVSRHFPFLSQSPYSLAHRPCTGLWQNRKIKVTQHKNEKMFRYLPLFCDVKLN